MKASVDEGSGSASTHPLLEVLRERLARRTPQVTRFSELELREAAVLVPLVVRDGELKLVVTRRNERMRSHAGQMAFPGGSREPSDPTALHTALRETEEEVGVSADAVQIFGQLDETPTLTSYRIIPFVGIVAPGVTWRPCPEEVAQILELPFGALMAPGVHRTEPHFAIGRTWQVDYYDVPTADGVCTIWGATARIVRNLLTLAR